jgi:hypothetical protein
MSIYKKAKYRVIILKDGKYLSTILRCQKRSTAFIRYRKFKEENKVLFPQKFINNVKGVKPVEFEIVVVKNTEPDDKFRTVRNKLGKVYIEKPLFGIWTILDKDEYNFEETFWVYGMSNKKGQRPTIKEILKRLTVGAYKKEMSKMVCVLYNKLLIYNEEHFDMILCKNKSDAQRLQQEFYKASKANKIKSFIFIGTVRSKKLIVDLYQMIMEKTGWNKKKVQRYTNC